MRLRILVGALLIVVLAAGAMAASGDPATPSRQWAVAYLTQPTLLGLTIVQGPVLFTHDNAKMARGEPCTTVYLFEPAKGPAQEVWSFHCIPTPRKVASKFTITTHPNTDLGYGCVLTSYQFAGDAEAHGVPSMVNAH
jgi:hypothetical protein